MSSYHIDQLGRIVELVRSTPFDCTGCMYFEGRYRSCLGKNKRPLDVSGNYISCRVGQFVEVVHE